MDYRKLGRTGLKVSELCLGTMQFGWTADEPLSHRILSAAYDAGLNFIDTADMYSNWAPNNPGGVSETIIGNWLKAANIPRDQVIIATKARAAMGSGPNDSGLSRLHLMHAVEASLRRLQTDYIDLYQTHWPDDDTPQDETLRALDDLVRQGKVRYLGCSNYPAWQLVESLWLSDRHNLARYDSIQPHYSLVHRAEFERELAAVCRTYGIGVIPYSPLEGGFLTGKYRRGQELPDSVRQGHVRRYLNDRNWDLLDRMETIGNAHGKSISQVALAWQLTQPVITAPIIGPRTLEQLNDNLGAAGFRLTPDDMAELHALSAWKPDDED